MVKIQIQNEKQNTSLVATGVLEMGRGPEREAPRFLVDDPTVSRDHLRVEELPEGRIRLENLSTSRPVVLNEGQAIPPGSVHTLTLPVSLTAGMTRIELSIADSPHSEETEPPTSAPASSHTTWVQEDVQPLEERSYQTIASRPVRQPVDEARRPLGLPRTKAQMDPETLAQWLETVLALQQTTAGSKDFYRQTAQAMAELIELDLGLVLQRRNDAWTIAGAYAANDRVNVRYSRTLLSRVANERRTVYLDFNSVAEATSSLVDVDAAVVSPIFDAREEVVGALYGMRAESAVRRGGIQPLEAQLVQLLAHAVSSHQVRSAATRTRVQFEQFFSPELVRELERDPNLLEGRSQEVTVLFSDLRGFTKLSQELGPQVTCRLLRDMMERLTEHIVGHGGVIVDYAGDGILAMWNAPSPQPDHALRACSAGLDMLGTMTDLNERWRETARGNLALGIGLNTGIAQVGNTGSSRRFKYGPHGHTVNLASRVQDATKKLGLPLLITDATRALLPADMAVRRVGRVRLPGVQEPVVLHELHGRNPPLQWQALRDTYELALEQFERRDWAMACESLVPLAQMFEQAGYEDEPTLKLMRRACECLETRPEPFEAVIEVTTK
jgi:adenylate cyclase